MEEQIQKKLEISCVDEEAYLNELVTCQLQFDGFTFDQLIGKLVEVLVTIFQKFSHVWVVTITISSWNKIVVTTSKELKPIRRGAKLAIVSCTLFYPQNLCKYLLQLLIIRYKDWKNLLPPNLYHQLYQRLGQV